MYCAIDALSRQNSTYMDQCPAYPVKLCDKITRIFKKFRDEIWGLANHSVQVVRRGVQITAKALPRFEHKMLRVFAGLGLAAGISALLTLSQYPDAVKGLLKNVELRDIEGAILSGFSLVISPLDMLDSTMTFAGSLAGIGAVPVISVFSLISLPVALTLLGYGTFRGIYDSVKLGQNLSRLPHKVSKDALDALKTHLEKLLTVTAAERGKIQARCAGSAGKAERKIAWLQARKLHRLTRQTDHKVVAKMSALLEQLEDKPEDLKRINRNLATVRTLMKRKMVVLCAGSVSGLSLWGTLAATSLMPVSIIAIAAQILLRNAFLLGKLVYMKEFYHRGA